MSILKQQLVEAQKNLAEAELRLKEHESGTHQVVEDWQCRLEESEERMRKQQAEKDGQMKHIIQRCVFLWYLCVYWGAFWYLLWFVSCNTCLGVLCLYIFSRTGFGYFHFGFCLILPNAPHHPPDPPPSS